MATYFQDCGVIVGLVSYPFHVDGEKLYEEVFKEQFFTKYKRNINKYSTEPLEDHLYTPTAYRLFGNYGLAILSLIDDFAFPDRIFHSNHGYGEEDYGEETRREEGVSFDFWKYQYNCKSITGIMETDQEDPGGLKNKAEQTFLRKDKKYPFIGIIKLKIDYHLLAGRGMVLTTEVKKRISRIGEHFCGDEDQGTFDFIILDCFDNDELTVLAFSNNLLPVNQFFSGIRNLTYNTLVKELKGEEVAGAHQHIFSSSHINLGYHIAYRFGERMPAFMLPVDIQKVNLKLIWEPKVGHGRVFEKNIPVWLSEPVRLERALTGGSTFSQNFSLEKIHLLEKECAENHIKQHVRRIKITLCWQDEEYPGAENDALAGDDGAVGKLAGRLFDPGRLGSIRKLLNECRVSKIAHERLLKIYGLFNEHIQNRLHAGYFLELWDALDNMENQLRDCAADHTLKIGDIDRILSETITSLEEAFYNRFHEKEIQDNNLEYNGGIQQHLTSFDFVYKNIVKLFYPPLVKDEANRSFVSISGYEKVTSIRNNLRLNINQITYPELFAISVWKEAANFSYAFVRDEVDGTNSKEADRKKKLDAWSKFIGGEELCHQYPDDSFPSGLFCRI